MDDKAAAEALIPRFRLERLLNQDQNGRRISLLGKIGSKPALLTAERAALPSDPTAITAFLSTISSAKNLGANDIYHWYLASVSPSQSPSLEDAHSAPVQIPSLKINLIYPCTQKHVSKYSAQQLRMVTETPQIYSRYIRPLMSRNRSDGRLDWVFNIIEGRTEQEDIILRAHSTPTGSLAELDEEGFLILPDLNWDRKTMSGLHLLALVERRDIWSLRDLKRKHVGWLRRMRDGVLDATVKVYGDQGVDRDMLKLYVHYQPTYYHFHIHIVNVSLEPSGNTQSTGKAFGLEHLISQLELMDGPARGPLSSSSSSASSTALAPDAPPHATTKGRGDQTILENIDGIDTTGQATATGAGAGNGAESGSGFGERGLHEMELTYFLGEESEIWREVFGPLKRGEISEN